MKCALELQAIATARSEEKRRLKEKAEAERQAQIYSQTIEYCEQIGKKLEEKAEDGRVPDVHFYFRPEYGNPNQGCALKQDSRSLYADKRTTHSLDGNTFDLSVMAEWFKHYCFVLRYSETGTWAYGAGLTTAYLVTIKPSPECRK